MLVPIQTSVAYLIDYRLKTGMELLSSTELPITEICLETGFASPSYFTETFRSHFGCSPKEYRQKCRNL